MFQTPLGGISLVINIIILIIGSILNTVKGNPLYTAIISQKHILKLEKTKNGSLVTIILAYLIPLSILTLVGGISVVTLDNLYHDSRKITVVDAVEDSIHFSLREIDIVAGKTKKTVEKGVSLQEGKTQGMVLSESSTTKELYTIDFFLAVDDTFNKMVEKWVVQGPKASTTFLLFPKGRGEPKLIPFMQANGLPTNLESRKVMALFFGIGLYEGTERQNNLLRKKLGEIMSNQLTQFSELITKQ